jgi:flavorubredoxin
VLIDTVDPPKEEEFFENLKEAKLEKLDYVIANHAEQDHSGTLPKVIRCYPDAKIVTNEKCKGMLIDLMPELKDDNFHVIEDGDTLSLGDKTLEFVFTPWVHWPETISTYLKEDKILFSCDWFGSHMATTDLFVKDEAKTYEAAKRYYAEIMMPFRAMIKNNLQKIESYDIDIIATSHGPIYNNPKFIIDAYKDWVSDDVKDVVLIPYVSMHGSTDKIVEYLVDSLVDKGVNEVKPFNLTDADIGELAIDLVDAATIIIGTPTVLAGPHPSAVYAAYLANILRSKTRFVSIVGSYGWGGQTVEKLKGLIGNLNVELIEPVIIKGYPKDEDFEALDKLADEVAKKHKLI